MGATREGGLKAAATNKKRHGNDFYREIALLAQVKWRANGRKPRGFAANREIAREAGRRGGMISRRPKKILTIE